MPDEPEAGLLDLHRRLIDGDPTVPGQLAERLVPHLLRRLEGLARSTGDPHMVTSQIGLVVARYLREPERYAPERAGLVPYLAMEVRGDVLNELKTRTRRRSRETPIDEHVELRLVDRDSSVEEAALDTVDPVGVAPDTARAMLQAVADFDAVDRQVPQMIADGVRSTSAYAAVLGLSHLPVDVQRTTVRRHKDRILKRVERLRDRLA
jgi:RNA polymerase sigma-70 factor (ECF subfamily)